LVAVIKADFKKELLAGSKVNATNVRGNDNQFGPANTIDNDKNSYWATEDTVKEASIEFEFEKPTAINRILLQEYIKLGQRVKTFNVEVKTNGKWETIANETTIGYKRILRTKRVLADALKINITATKASVVISNIQAYNAPTFVRIPSIERNKNGEVSMKADEGNSIYYTVDGSNPSEKSTLYKGVFKYDKAFTLKAIARNTQENISSAVKIAKYGVSKEKWKIIAVSSGYLKTADKIIDGNPDTDWSFGGDANKLPQQLSIDMGAVRKITGFTYVPQQVGNNLNLISNYEFYTSTDNVKWIKQSQGEFSNIKNNPIEQVKTFGKVAARYLRFTAIAAVGKGQVVAIGEINVIEE
jgi:alpha-L-fucosidase